MTSTVQSGLGEAKERGPEASAAIMRPSLVLKRRLNASPEAVFSAWTDPAKVSQWFACAGSVVTDASFDLRVGGRYTIANRKESGEENRVSGTYLEIVPNRKLVFTWAPEQGLRAETLVTVAITADGAGSLLTLTHEMFVDEAMRDQHEGGWTGCLDKLAAFLA